MVINWFQFWSPASFYPLAGDHRERGASWLESLIQLR